MSISTEARRGGKARSPAKLRRILALVRKESYEVVRDPSSVAIGIAMPVVLILLVRLRPFA